VDAADAAPAADAGAEAASDAGAGADGAAGAEQAQCAALFGRLLQRCPVARNCDYRAYSALCAGPHPAAVAEVFSCFEAPDAGCWSPADSNTARGCVDTAIRRQNPMLDTVLSPYCARCSPSGTCSGQGLPYAVEGIPPSFLTDANAAALTQCLTAAGTCAAANACFEDAVRRAGLDYRC